MAATTQIVAALVKPTTAPRAWRIVPAPMKPTPVTICAATRVVSVPGGIAPPMPLIMASERCVYSTEPMQIKMLVLSPAGFPPSSRSRPMAPPSSVARPSCNIRSRRKISMTRWNISPMEQPHLGADIRDRALCQRARAIRAIAQSIEHARGFALQRRRALAQRRERGDDVVGQHALAVETPPPRGPALVRHLRNGVGRREPLMDGENVADLRGAGILPCHAGGIGRGGPQLLPDRFRGFEQADPVPQTLGPLGFAVEAAHPLRPGQIRLRLGEEVFREAGIPAARNFAHQLEMLNLILTYRGKASFIQQNVSCLQYGVGQQPHGDALLALRLVLEPCLALELAERRHRREQPVELGVFGDMRLHEHDALLRVQAGSEKTYRHIESQRGQGAGVVRLRDRVQIDDREETVILGLQPYPVLHGAEIVADVQLTGRLDAAEHAFRGHGGHGATRCVNTTT